MVWKSLLLPNPTDIQYDIAEYLQNGPNRRCILGFRGVAKTWLTGAYAAWRLYKDPQVKVVIASASKGHADDISNFILTLFDSIPELEFLKPTGRRAARDKFDVGPAKSDVAPSVRSVGILGQKTGGRADLVILDDVEIPENSATHMMREKIAKAVSEFAAILKPDDGTEIVYLGTPQLEMSLYTTIPSRGYDVRIWPARYPSKELLDFYGDKLSPLIRGRLDADPSLATRYGEYGESTEPQRFSHYDLLARELELRKSGFQLQYMLNTKLSDAERFPLKLADLIVMNCNTDTAPEKPIWAASPELIWDSAVPNVGLPGDYFYRPMATRGDWVDYQGAVMYVDPSGRGADETAYSIVKFLNGYLYVLECKGFRDGYGDKTMMGLMERAKHHKVNKILVEDNFGDGMFLALLKPWSQKIYPVALEGVRVTGQKERRIIDILEPVMNQHKLVMDRKVIVDDYHETHGMSEQDASPYRLIYQLSRLTVDRGCLKHDDRLDSLAGAVHYWTQQMSKDADRAMADRKQELLMKELRDFAEEADRGPRRGSGAWCKF